MQPVALLAQADDEVNKPCAPRIPVSAQTKPDRRTSTLYGEINLTNRNFFLVEDRSFLPGEASREGYIGENSAIKRIQQSIYIDATVPALAHDKVADRSARGEIDGIRNRIVAYRNRYLARVKSLEFSPRGLLSEVNVIANALGGA